MKFNAQAQAFGAFVGTVPFADFPAPTKEKGRVAVLISPWLQTSVPWYSAALALLERAEGSDVFLVFDDRVIPNEFDPPYQIEAISGALAELERHVDMVRISTLPAEPLTAMDEAEVERLTELHLVSTLKHSFTAKPRAEVAQECRAALADRLGKLKHLFATTKLDHAIVPGGIYAAAGIMLYLGKQLGVRIASYDSGPGSVCLGVDDVAGHGMDISKMFNPEHADYVAAHKDVSIELARREVDLRMKARDRYSYQLHAYEAGEAAKCDVLIPLSVFDDVAGLGRTVLFTNAEAWVLETVEFLLRETTASIIVREHPAARILTRPDHFADLLKNRFGDEPRLRFIGCRENVSTYNLLDAARVVLPCSGTVGIEAAALGKKVILESCAYYSRLSFVERGDSKEDYLRRIKRALDFPEPLSEEVREQAWLCYFYGQVASFVDCEFTPNQVDYPKWCRQSFRRLARNPRVRLISDSLRLGIPSARLQSEVIFSGARKSFWQRLFS